MRTRRFANTERIRAKERRLLEVLRRKQAALSYGMFPSGPVLTGPNITATTGAATVTVQTPLRMIVPTAGEVWQVDFDEVPDSTGGFGDVTIPAAKQIAELADTAVVSLTGQSVGEYVVYAQHVGTDENPEEREPPSKFAGGTGAYEEHRDFFGHVHADGTPIPREGYDSTLVPEIVSEYVDRLTIGVAASSAVPSNGVPLISVAWDGTGIASRTNLYTVVRVDDVRDSGVTSAKIATGAVTTPKLADRAVTVDKLAFSAVERNRIANDAVNSDKLADLSVRSEHLAEGAVTGEKIYPSAVAEQHMGNSSISSRTIVDNAVTKVKVKPFQFLPNGLFFATARIKADGTLYMNYLPDGWQLIRFTTGAYHLTYPENYVIIFAGATGDYDNTFTAIVVSHDMGTNTVAFSPRALGTSGSQAIDADWSLLVVGYDTNG